VADFFTISEKVGYTKIVSAILWIGSVMDAFDYEGEEEGSSSDVAGDWKSRQPVQSRPASADAQSAQVDFADVAAVSNRRRTG